MFRAGILLAIVAVSLAQDDFFEKYSFTKVMSKCFGEDLYYGYLNKIGKAQRECQQFPVSNLHTVNYHYYSQVGYPVRPVGQPLYVQYPTQYLGQSGQHYGIPETYPRYHYVQKRQAEGEAPAEAPTEDKPFFDKYYLLDSINTITAALSNYTCTLHQLEVIDEYLNLQAPKIIEDIKAMPIKEELKKDLSDGVAYCWEFTYCLPLERLKSPLPINLQRLLLAMKCIKETRVDACFKEDLRKNIQEFDLSLFPEDDDLESKISKLSAIVMESDSISELEIL